MMKKRIAAVFAALMMTVSGNLTAFAANQTEKDIQVLGGPPISENGIQYRSDDAVVPNQTVYFLLPDNVGDYLKDEDYFRMTVRKEKNGKLVKSVKLVEKILTKDSKIKYPVKTFKRTSVWDTAEVTGYARNTYIAVDLNELLDDEEYKVSIRLNFTARRSIPEMCYGHTPPTIAKDGQRSKFTSAMSQGERLPIDVEFFVKNREDRGDASISLGLNQGKTVKPIANETNEVLFEGEDVIASVLFNVSSNPDSFYAKMSTKWSGELLRKFRNTDAVIRVFTPATIDATSRATLRLYNPFYEDSDIQPEDCYIYHVNSSGKITDVSGQFSYDSNEDAFVTRTRTLSTWIISPVEVKL